MNAVTVMDENDQEIKSPMKRVGSTRKILIFNNIRQQLNEQLRSLDVRVESQISLIQELQDFFRRRGELELDYSKSLDKFARSLLLRHKEQKQKREQWPIFSTFSCWQHLVNQTQALSKDHATLSDLYSVNIVNSLQTTVEDVQRIYKKCRAIGYEIHEEILRVLQELHATMKTYQRYESEYKAAEIKLITAETQRIKLQQTISKDKLERSKKYKLTEKEVIKRKTKYTDAKLKAIKAKSEYQLCLEASNTTIHKYFVEDLSDLIDCMDLGFSSMISRAILMHVFADQGRSRAILQQADGLSNLIHSIDSRADKQKFLEQHHAAYMIPKRLEFQGQINNDPIEPDIQKIFYLDLEQRLQMLGQRLGNLRTESEEIWKTLEMAEIKLLEYYNNKDYDTSEFFNENKASLKPSTSTIISKIKSDKQEIEDFYISKIREYMKGTSRIARLEAKAEFLRSILASGDESNNLMPHTNAIVLKRKRIGRIYTTGQPKLFGGSLEEYLESTGEEVPLIMRSCIRVINLYGLHHQGIFRVSGSQVEITNFRERFERGEDPLADTNDASDINSVAGVLKLYLRELREPLFPIIYFDYFISIAELRTKDEIVLRINKFLQSLPRSVLIVIRYLFAFLNHLSEYADENMMDAYNLAICFGPTLMPAPEDKDQVQYQNQVNELIKNMIVYHEELFPKDLVGLEYEKYISHEPFIDIDVGDSPTEAFAEDPDSEVYPSEDESEIVEAMVQFDFNARSSRELSLRKGDNVVLRKQVSNDWWQGVLNGKEGLIPDKYISLKIKDEDRDKFISLQLNIEECEHKTETKPISDNSAQYHVEDCSVKDLELQTVAQQINNSIQTNTDMNSFKPLSFTRCDDISNIADTFAYHDESRAFESTMEYQNTCNKYEDNTVFKKTEPIYAEPIKVYSATTQCAAKKEDENIIDKTDNLSSDSSSKCVSTFVTGPKWNETAAENRDLNKFQQHKKLWEEISSGSCSSKACHSRIFKSKHTAPDLVMDLPFSTNELPTLKVTKSSLIPKTMTDEEMSSAERFALQNQSTIKRNEHAALTADNNKETDEKELQIKNFKENIS